MDMVFVKPAEGSTIHQVERNMIVMPPGGALVPRDLYYTKLIAAGDVIEQKQQPEGRTNSNKPQER